MRRPGTPDYFVCFRDTQGRRRELTTGEKAKHFAEEAAPEIIRTAYAVKAERTPWDEALKLMRQHMEAKNLRPASIEQYELVVSVFRKLFPDSQGPADITPAMAQDFMVKRSGKVAPRTMEGNLDNLSIVFGHWFRDTLRIIKSDPFADVEPPKHDKKPPRIIAAEESKAFFDWMQATWEWRLPLLFLETKAAIGCRIGELTSAVTTGLRDGRIRFVSETTKGRKERACRLPAALFAELQGVAGPIYVFEQFSEELRQARLKRGHPNHTKAVLGFTPDRMVNWLQDQARAYFKASGAERFKLHNFRGTAMSKARMARIADSDAAIAFGCNPQTMRQHYQSLDEAEIADDVFSRMQAAE
jgi:site-specific recombinase XerD